MNRTLQPDFPRILVGYPSDRMDTRNLSSLELHGPRKLKSHLELFSNKGSKIAQLTNAKRDREICFLRKTQPVPKYESGHELIKFSFWDDSLHSVVLLEQGTLAYQIAIRLPHVLLCLLVRILRAAPFVRALPHFVFPAGQF